MKKIIIFILVIIIIGLCFIGVKKYFMNKEEFDSKTEIDEVSSTFHNIENELGWLLVVNSIDNYTASASYKITKDKDLFSLEGYKQLFIMEYILSDMNNYDDFVVLNSYDYKEVNDLSPTSDTTIAYYPYDKFNNIYLNFFGTDFDIKTAKRSNTSNEYNDSKDYVYYENRRSGANGLGIDSLSIEDITKEEDNYKMQGSISYTERLASNLDYNSDSFEIVYQKKDDKIILKTFIVKGEK